VNIQPQIESNGPMGHPSFTSLGKRSAIVVLGLLAGSAIASACGDDSDSGVGPSSEAGAGDASRLDDGALVDGPTSDTGVKPQKKECLPYVQNGTPLALAPVFNRISEVPRLIAPDPVGNVLAGSSSVIYFDLRRDNGSVELECHSSTLSVQQVFADPDGNAYIPGSFRFNMDIHGAAPDGGLLHVDAEGKEIFLAKFAPNGSLVSFKRYAGRANITGGALAPNGHVWLAGTMAAGSGVDFGLGPVGGDASPGSAFLVELDAGGTALFNRTFGNADTKTGKVAIASDGGPVVGLYLRSAIPGDPDQGIGVAAFTNTGADKWVKAFQSTSSSSGAPPDALVTSPLGGVAIGGRYQAAINFGGAALPAPTEGSSYVARFGADGSYVGDRGFTDTVTTYFAGVPLAFRDDGTLLVGASLKKPVDLGTGMLTPIANQPSPLLLTFDGAMKVTAATAFAPTCAETGGGAIVGLALGPGKPLRIVATAMVMGNETPYSAAFTTYVNP
jgi:hypothetical protein